MKTLSKDIAQQALWRDQAKAYAEAIQKTDDELAALALKNKISTRGLTMVIAISPFPRTKLRPVNLELKNTPK